MSDLDNMPKPGTYRHFKGGYYEVEGVATHSETGELYVVYRALYGDCKRYIRPLDMFMSPVDRSKYPEADQVSRFEYVGKSEISAKSCG